MTETEARLVLGLGSLALRDEIQEAYEEAVFEQASFFMRRVFIPKLVKARIKRLVALAEAAEKLGVDEIKSKRELVINMEDVTRASDHFSLVTGYNRNEVKIKLALSDASSAALAKSIYLSWIELFERYAKRFIQLGGTGKVAVDSKLTEAPIFNGMAAASESEREVLVSKEYSRLVKLVD